MTRQKKNKSGFRTFELDTLHYQNNYFQRFVHRYPQAIAELHEMLPLFETIFGRTVDVDITHGLVKTHLFDQKFLTQPQEILARVWNHGMDYGSHRFIRPTLFIPKFISMPADHVGKANETYNKRVIETDLVWGVAELRAESGDNRLFDRLTKREEFISLKEAEFKEIIKKFLADKNIDLPEQELSYQSYSFTVDFLEASEFHQDDEINSLLKNFWEFYIKFHNWIEKYQLYRGWLRRSFFLALRRGLQRFWADVQTSSFHLPPELQTELFGDSYNSFGFSHNSLPEPQEFIINLSRYLPGVNELVTSNEKWASDPFWIFESPVEYVARAVQKLKVAIDRVPFFASEQSIINLFTNFTNEIMPSESGDLADSFRNHLRDFPLFQDLVRQREDIVESYRRHMEEYLDNLLPIISKYVRTNEGAPPKFERINWLLDWNVENLTARQIVEKYNLSDESTVRKALADFKAYNLPVKEKVGKAMNWNDDWFLNRLKAGFPDRKKLIKSSSEKV